MTTDAPVEIGSLLTHTPGVQGGQLCIAGTRMRVLTVAALYSDGLTAEEIADGYSLSRSHVHAAVAYYLANKAQVDASIDEERALHDCLASATSR